MEPISENLDQPITAVSTKSITPLGRPTGEVLSPALICGAVGAVLTIILALIGRYTSLDLSLKEYYMGKPFYMAESAADGFYPVLDWFLVVALTFGVSFAVLDTDKTWRRVMIILLFAVVVILASPVLMLWDIFWSPVTVFVGVLWSWICAFIYSCQHTMPCETLLPREVKREKKEKIDTSPLEAGGETPEEKYQPKDQHHV